MNFEQRLIAWTTRDVVPELGLANLALFLRRQSARLWLAPFRLTRCSDSWFGLGVAADKISPTLLRIVGGRIRSLEQTLKILSVNRPLRNANADSEG